MQRPNRNLKSWLLAAAAAIGFAAPVAHAQAEAENADERAVLDVIVVTAQRREEQSADVPISVTSLGQSQLAVANVTTLADTAKLTPGLRFDSQGPAVQPTIRGVGTAITTSGGGPNVGIYVDGFFQANTYLNDFQLMSTESLQVLKGPQGTLFGRNTTGGAILVNTADPSFDPAAQVKAQYGSFNTAQLQAYATGGLGDRVAVDVEGIFRSSDSFQTDLATGDDSAGAYENWSVRFGMKAELTDTVSLLLRYSHSESNNPMTQLVNAYVDESGGAGFLDKVSEAGQAFYGASDTTGRPLVYFYAPEGTFTTEPGDVILNNPVSFETESDVFQATVEADLGFADLTSYTQYRTDKSPYFGDLDATTLPFFQILVDVDDTTMSQEFLLNSKPGGRLQWTGGLAYFQIEDTWDIGASFGDPFFDFGGSTTTTTSYAAFFDATYEIMPEKLFVTVGGRLSNDTVSDASFQVGPFLLPYEDPNGVMVDPVDEGLGGDDDVPVDDLDDTAFTPRVVMRYKPTEESSVYASYTRGYKAGILNVGGKSQVPVEPEEIDAFEVGYKFDNQSLAVDLAGFLYDYKNLQVSSFQNGAAQIRNAAEAEISGLEAQGRYQVTEAFNVNGGVAWTNAEYNSFTNAPFYTYCDPTATLGVDAIACVPTDLGGYGDGALTQVTTDASGLAMQRAPEITGNIGASYVTNLAGGSLTVSGNLYYTSEFYFDPSEQFLQDAYQILSMRAEWVDPSETYSVAVFGDNLTDEEYRSQVLFNTLGIGSVWAPPATFGIEVGAKF